MYPKHKTEKLISSHAPALIKALGLSRWRIKIHVYRSGDKRLIKKGVAPTSICGLYGITFLGSKAADIIIFYDQVPGRFGALETLIHELLHCALSPLTELITLGDHKAHKIEERIVQHLSPLFVGKRSLDCAKPRIR